jgi:predicted nucleotidyltransferase
MGIEHLAIFGSTARDEQRPDSDVDLAAKLDDSQSFGLMRLVQMEESLQSLLGIAVDLVTEPSDTARLQADIDRDRVHVF